MRLPDPSPVLDKYCAPAGSVLLSSTGAGVWRKAPMAFSDSSSALDKFQSANFTYNWSEKVCRINNSTACKEKNSTASKKLQL